MNYVLTTNNICKHYRHFEALNGLSIHVPQGSIYGFVGKNGAGKTTLIRLISGLQTPTSGEYTLYGVDSRSNEIGNIRRRMGAVIETPSIYMDMTAEENLKVQYKLLGLSNNMEIHNLLELVGLGDTGKKKVRNFSLGMKQRLGIAVALVGSPDFLVLDEPTNGLDPQGIIEMRELILKLNREHHITVLISSHILDELSKVATHYGFINAGRTVKEISAEELEAACRKGMRVEVSNTKTLSHLLDEMGVEYAVISATQVDVYAKLNVSKLTLALAEKNCEVKSIQEHDETLESYFVDLIRGAGNA